MIVTTVGFVVEEPQKITTKSGTHFYSFKFSCKKIRKPASEEESQYIYFSCYLHPSKENLVKFIRKGGAAMISGQVNHLNGYFSESKKQIIVSPQITVLAIQFIPKGGKDQPPKNQTLKNQAPNTYEPVPEKKDFVLNVPSKSQKVGVFEPDSSTVPEWRRDDPEMPF